MLRTALLWGNTINLDSDYSKYIETISDPWVIEGFAVEEGKVKPGKAWVKVTRSNGESLFVLVQNTQDIPVSLNGDVFIGIEVAQNAIDNGLINNEDGTGIASIKVWPQKPNQNYLLLAVWQGGRLSDKREIIPRLQSLSSRTSTLEAKVQRAEGSISTLQENRAPLYLAEYNQVMEDYQLSDQMVKHQFATDDEAFYGFPLGQNANNVNIEIWFVCDGKPFQSLSIFVSQEWNANRGLDCHFYRAEEVEIDGKRTWRRTGGLIEGSRIEGRIEANKTKVKIIPNNPITMPKGTKMVAVVFPVNNTINNERYYKIYGNPFLSSAASPVSYKTSGNQRLALNTLMFLQGDGLEKNLIIKKKDFSLAESLPREKAGASYRITVQKNGWYFVSFKSKLQNYDRLQVFIGSRNIYDTSSTDDQEIERLEYLLKGEILEFRYQREASWRDNERYTRVQEIFGGSQWSFSFPRVQKSRNEMVECTRAWEHINGLRIHYENRIDLNLTTTGQATGARTAPNDGVLYYNYTTIEKNGKIWQETINNKNIALAPKGKGSLLVKTGDMITCYWSYRYDNLNRRDHQGSISLTYFIPFQ